MKQIKMRRCETCRNATKNGKKQTKCLFKSELEKQRKHTKEILHRKIRTTADEI